MNEKQLLELFVAGVSLALTVYQTALATVKGQASKHNL